MNWPVIVFEFNQYSEVTHIAITIRQNPFHQFSVFSNYFMISEFKIFIHYEIRVLDYSFFVHNYLS